MAGLPELDPTCVFCPGNENLNPDLCDEVCRVPNTGQWELRVIPNKYRALDHSPVQSEKGFYHSRTGYGDHEVIVTRKHNEPVALQSAQLIALSLQNFKDRIIELSKDKKKCLRPDIPQPWPRLRRVIGTPALSDSHHPDGAASHSFGNFRCVSP